MRRFGWVTGTPAPAMHFEIGHSARLAGQWYWHLVGANGEIIAQRSHHATRAAAFESIRQLLGAQSIPVYERQVEQRWLDQLGDGERKRA